MGLKGALVPRWLRTFLVWFLFSLPFIMITTFFFSKLSPGVCLESHVSELVDQLRRSEELPLDAEEISFFEVKKSCISFINRSREPSGTKICIASKENAKCLKTKVTVLFYNKDGEEINTIVPGIYKLEISYSRILFREI